MIVIALCALASNFVATKFFIEKTQSHANTFVAYKLDADDDD